MSDMSSSSGARSTADAREENESELFLRAAQNIALAGTPTAVVQALAKVFASTAPGERTLEALLTWDGEEHPMSFRLESPSGKIRANALSPERREALRGALAKARVTVRALLEHAEGFLHITLRDQETDIGFMRIAIRDDESTQISKPLLKVLFTLAGARIGSLERTAELQGRAHSERIQWNQRIGELSVRIADRINNPLAVVLLTVEEICEKLAARGASEELLKQGRAIAEPVPWIREGLAPIDEYRSHATPDALRKQEGAGRRSLLLVTAPYPPFVLPKGHPYGFGIDVDVAKEALHRVDPELEIEVSFAPWEKCLQMLESGEADFTVAIAANKKRSTYLDWSTNYALEKSGYALLTLRETPLKVESLSDLTGLCIGVVANFVYPSAFSCHPGLRFLQVNGVRSLIEKLVAKECDVILLNSVVGVWHLRETGLQDELRALPVIFLEEGSLGPRMGFSKKRNLVGLIQRLNPALTALQQDGTYASIVKRYANILELMARANDAVLVEL